MMGHSSSSGRMLELRYRISGPAAVSYSDRLGHVIITIAVSLCRQTFAPLADAKRLTYFQLPLALMMMFRDSSGVAEKSDSRSKAR